MQVPDGGWFPLVFAAVLLGIGLIWQWGTSLKLHSAGTSKQQELDGLLACVEGTAQSTVVGTAGATGKSAAAVPEGEDTANPCITSDMQFRPSDFVWVVQASAVYMHDASSYIFPHLLSPYHGLGSHQC